MKKAGLLLIYCCSNIILCYGQQDAATKYVGHYILKNAIKDNIIFDKVRKITFSLDSAHIRIKAIDSNGQRMWDTDPWKDSLLDAYRVKRPTIVQFYFGRGKRTGNKDVIWIVYENTQFGYLDEQTGAFKFLGQD